MSKKNDNIPAQTAPDTAPQAAPQPAAAPPAETAPAEEAVAAAAAEDAPAEPAGESEAEPAEEAADAAPEAPEAPEEAPAEEGEPEAESETPAEDSAPTDEEAPAEEDAPAEAPTEEAAADEDAALDAAETDEETVELPPIDEKRLLDMTRTVQLSVEQITANMDIPAEEDTDTSSDDDAAEDDTPATVGDVVRSGVTGMARWLLLVVVFVLVVAGIGVAYLYRSATPDMLPSIRVTFAGQTLEPSAYKWHVPVIGNWFKRTYAETYSSVPTVLEDPISTLSPDITISSINYATQLTVTDADKETVFEGTLSEFSGYCFDETGTYTAKLVASVTGSRAAGAADITGSETWLFTFDIAIEPSVYLSENTIQQGGVAAIRVTGSYEDDAPTLTTTLKNQGFIQSSNGWVCYLPIPWNAALGTETIDVQVGRYSTTLYLKVTDGGFNYKDYSSQSQRAALYIGQDDAPAKVSKLFTAAPTGISWADAGFVQPFLNRLNTTLTFGATEYVGRRYSERGTNTGAGGRTSTNVILSTTRGELVIAPASGKIDLAEDLGGDYGYTLVIDHGAGVRTIFYGLSDVDIKAGQQVKQGQTLATCGKTTVVEMRIGTVPIDPIAVWRGQCNGLKYY
ncbi:M23 family metallopeptidase [uncultured Gemmiger sp.]|uniref:murein hydrolase activator EnvC family protein n=1 Tax=uncultured Gemmiger sp. TaxID=1623490 RepID=UPI0025E270C1|nr:M23 family metallopeptidase [uncultured Gemmiger sp.]